MKKSLIAGALVLGSLSAAVSPVLAASGPIKIVLAEEADLLEPCMATRSNIGRIIMENVSETLTELDVRGKKGVQPRLAEKWEQNADGSWRFHLREGVKFSDGTAFDAKDVKHSFERIMSDKNACESRRYFGGMTVTPSIVDDHTIDFKTDPAQPILPLLMSLVTIVPEETKMEFIREPVGTGPYKLTNWTPGQQIVLTARDDYWGAKPQVTEATYLFRADPSVRAAMVQTGEADLSPSISQARRYQYEDRLFLSRQRDGLYASRSQYCAAERCAGAPRAQPCHRPAGLPRHPGSGRCRAGHRARSADHAWLEPRRQGLPL